MSNQEKTPSRLLILKTGTLAGRMPELVHEFGDCDEMFIAGTACGDERVAVVAVHEDEDIPEPPGSYAGVLITGSSAMVSSPTPWMQKTAEWLRDAVAEEVPVLGVCFGHQLLAYALGGTVGVNPAGPEAGTISVRFNERSRQDPLFCAMPAQALFNAHHYETVLTLPEDALVLGDNPLDRHQAVRYGPKAWGIQFHPEISGPIMSALMNTVGPTLDENGVSAAAIVAAVEDTPVGTDLLRHYCRMVLGDI